MFEYLGPGEIDAIRLYVVDMNQAAINLYFKLGFKVTQWFFRKLGGETGFKAAFLCMQKMQGERLHTGLAISLQEMPHLFSEQIVGQAVYVCKDGSCQKSQCALIEEYDSLSETFTLVYLPEQVRHRKVDVNDLFSCGNLTFEVSPSVCLQKISRSSANIRKCDMAKGVDDSEPSPSHSSPVSSDSPLSPASSENASVDQSQDFKTPEKTCGEQPRKRRRWKSTVICPPKSEASAAKMCMALATLPTPCRALAKAPGSGKGEEKTCTTLEIQSSFTLDFKIAVPQGKPIALKPETAIFFVQDNPKKLGSRAWLVYERYKVAKTIDEFIKLQGPKRSRAFAKRDLEHDVRHCYAKFSQKRKAASSSEVAIQKYVWNTAPEHMARIRDYTKVGTEKPSGMMVLYTPPKPKVAQVSTGRYCKWGMADTRKSRATPSPKKVSPKKSSPKKGRTSGVRSSKLHKTIQKSKRKLSAAHASSKQLMLTQFMHRRTVA